MQPIKKSDYTVAVRTTQNMPVTPELIGLGVVATANAISNVFSKDSTKEVTQVIKIFSFK